MNDELKSKLDDFLTWCNTGLRDYAKSVVALEPADWFGDEIQATVILYLDQNRISYSGVQVQHNSDGFDIEVAAFNNGEDVNCQCRTKDKDYEPLDDFLTWCKTELRKYVKTIAALKSEDWFEQEIKDTVCLYLEKKGVLWTGVRVQYASEQLDIEVDLDECSRWKFSDGPDQDQQFVQIAGVIQTCQDNPEVVEFQVKLPGSIGPVPTPCRSSRSFILNQLQADSQPEVERLLQKYSKGSEVRLDLLRMQGLLSGSQSISLNDYVYPINMVKLKDQEKK